MEKQQISKKLPLEDHQEVLAHKFLCAGRIMIVVVRDKLMRGWRAYIGVLEKAETRQSIDEQRGIVLLTGSKLNDNEARGMFPQFNKEEYIQ